MSPYDEYKQKLRVIVQKQYTAWLMNNTKWREVFEILASMECVFKVDWIYGDAYDVDGSVIESFQWVNQPLEKALISIAGLRDPGIGGPFDYMCIYSLTVPRIVPEKISCRHDLRTCELASLARATDALGELPSNLDTDRWKLTAYAKREEL